MARNASARKPKKSDQLDAELAIKLQRHLDSLGMTSVDAYLSWCSRNGFARTTVKTQVQRIAETRFAQQVIADSRLSQSKREQRSFQSTLREIFEGRITEAQASSPALKLVCQVSRDLAARGFVRKAYFDLLLHVGETTDLLRNQPVIPQYGRAAENTYLSGLLALAHHANEWIRQPSTWKPTSHNVDRQFLSLSRHLFARWPVPTFMDSVWFQGVTPAAQTKQQWFIHLCRGENIRTANLPIPYTKRMAHHFMQAPNDFTVEDALRWGQITALGGHARLVKAILGTRLRTNHTNDEFWTTVIQFLIANPMLDLAQVGPIIDYLQHEKFTLQENVVEHGRVIQLPPPQPNLTMKGRTPESLMRNVETWHRTLAKQTQPAGDWAPSGIPGLRFIEGAPESGNQKTWTITELLSTAALVNEGRKMRHCVATYARSCVRGDCSIWAMELSSSEGQAKVLTLEVRNASKMLVQARGKFNILPTQKERSILHRWAQQAGIAIAQWI